MTLTYRALRGVFTAGLKGFYNTVEVRSRRTLTHSSLMKNVSIRQSCCAY